MTRGCVYGDGGIPDWGSSVSKGIEVGNWGGFTKKGDLIRAGFKKWAGGGETRHQDKLGTYTWKVMEKEDSLVIGLNKTKHKAEEEKIYWKDSGIFHRLQESWATDLKTQGTWTLAKMKPH